MDIRRGGRRERERRERGGERERKEVDMPTGSSRIKRPPPGAGRGNVKETERKKEKKEIWENEKIEE